MPTQIEEMRHRLQSTAAERRELEAQFSEDNLPSVEQLARIEAMVNAEADLREQLTRQEAFLRGQAERGAQAGRPQGGNVAQRDNGGQRPPQSIGDRFASSDAYQSMLARHAPGGRIADGSRISMDHVHVGGLRDLGLYGALVTGESSTSGGAFITADRFAEFTELGRRPLTMRDIIRVLRTDSDLVEYVRQTSRANNAAPVAEATAASGASGVKPESAMAFETVQTPVKTIANWIPVTRQAVADVPQMRDLIDTELRDNLAEELDEQIIAGDGIGQNFTGLINVSGTQAQAWDTNILTTTRKGRTLVRTVGRRTPTAYVLHPTDWQTIDLLQDNEARYYFGGPAMIGTPRLWGLPVVENEAMPVGTGMVGDFRRAALWDRQDTQILVSDSHSDFFIRNLLAILAELRAAFGVLQPSAFVELDLIA